MRNTITTVVFDIGNVLIEWNPDYLYRKLIPDDEERRVFLDTVCSMDWNLQQDLGRPWSEAVRTLVNQHPDKADLITAYSDRWHDMVPDVVSGTPEILSELKQQDTPLYAITNFSSEKFLEAQARFPFLKTSFQDIVVSADEKLIKPDPEIYKVLLDRNALAAEKCIFIDDSERNVEAARTLGMHAHHFTNAADLRNELAYLKLLPA